MAKSPRESDWIDKHSGSLINGILLAAILGITANSINQTALIQVHTKQLQTIEGRQDKMSTSIAERTADRFTKGDGDRLRDQINDLRNRVFDMRQKK